jgi:Xaa-Pro aminopeptidase
MTSNEPPTIPLATFENRRTAVCERIGEGVIVLPAAPTQRSSRDTERPYCPDRELYYLTGVTEPSSVGVLVGPQAKLVLFVREKDLEAELWAGPRLGPEEAGDRFGADECYPLAELGTRLPEILSASDRIYYRPGYDRLTDRLVRETLEQARSRGSRRGTGPRGVLDPGVVLDELRLVKDESELTIIRRACEISVIGHRAGAGVVEAEAGEWVVEAAVDHAFRAAGASGAGFDTIVVGGPNGCVLHYVDNRDTLRKGALVLIDAGAEFGLYHGDITRTYPVSGTFSSSQRDAYDLVDAAREAGIDVARAGNEIADIHRAATQVLVRGLVDLRVLSGRPEDLVAEGAHKPFFPHQTSHWLGLDVHDPGDYATGGVSRMLEPGMVCTVEPGLYFRPALCEGAAEAFAGIGIRIEDDVAITQDGCEVLTRALPTTADEIEALAGAGQ